MGRRRGARGARAAALRRLGAERPRRQGGAGGRHRPHDPRPRRQRAAGAGLAAGRRPLRPDRGARHPRGRRGRRRHRRPLPRPGRGRGRRPSTEDGEEAPPMRRSRAPRETKRYRANDFSISRQRSWGTPIPIIHCPERGPVPVPEADLPVVLPRDLVATGEGNPLAERPDFVDVDCPKCGDGGEAGDRHARLPLRRALPLGPGDGAAGGPGDADVHPPRVAQVAARRAAGRRRRLGRLRLRPAGRHQGAPRPRRVRLHDRRRALRGLSSSTRW